MTDLYWDSIYVLGHSFGVDDGHVTWIAPISQLLNDHRDE